MSSQPVAQPETAERPGISWPDLQRKAALDQTRRMVQGTIAVPGLLAALWLSSPYPVEHASPFKAFWVAVIVSGMLRIWLFKRAAQVYGRSTATLGAWQYVAAMLTAMANGVLYGHVLFHYGFASWTFTITMIWTVGAVSAATISFTPSIRLLRLYVLTMFLPVMVVAVVRGGREGYIFLIANVLFLVFLLAQGQGLHQSYWETLENQAKEAARREELEQARLAAEASNAAKSLFLANMSHEIRTPIHGILGMTAIARQTDEAEERDEALEVVQASAQALLHVLNDILDFSKIEAGKMTVETVPFLLADLLKEVRAMMEARIRAKGLEYELRVAPSMPRRLLGDPTRIKQVLLNLLGNAVKFCEQGVVRLSVDEDPAGLVLFAVSDTGIGIAKEHQESIFAAFAQADGSVSRKFGGTGLGLAICAELVRLMGGRIWVESEPGAGSTFCFTAALPVACEEVVDGTQELPDDVQFTRQLSILLAEDNPVNQRLAVRFLGSKGHRVSVVETGLEAIQSACAEEFDIILMDNQMPEMGGVEATGRIRQYELTAGRRRTPIVALTASAMRGDRERFFEAGMDGYLAKPFQARELYAAIAMLTDA